MVPLLMDLSCFCGGAAQLYGWLWLRMERLLL
jgi:hypothetical protein